MKWLAVLVFFVLFAVPSVLAAVNFNQTITPQEEAAFDGILAPVMKIYRFVQYSATVIGVLMFVFAGINFVTAGAEVTKKERAKHMAVGVIMGLILIWIAPLVVRYIFQ